ncbi:MAG: hypothetical protein GF350_06535, partial [Chitinivibrionales bacterium]|nr:hypothetical protein [Chitinivibrionales bacterium]
MQKIYKYQRYLLRGHAALYGLVLFALLFFWSIPWLIRFAGYMVIPEYYKMRIYLSITVLLFAGLVHFLSKEFKGTLYIVSDEKLELRQPYKKIVLYFENVTRFRYVEMPFVRGFAVISTPDLSIRLPFVIEHFSALVEAIYENLKRNNNEQVIAGEEYERLKRNALLNEQTTARIYR